MDSRLKRTAMGVALTAALVAALTAGTAQADGQHPGAGQDAGRTTDRVILKSSKAGSATLTLSAGAPRLVNGAAVRVTAEYSCPQGFDGYIDVDVVEVAGGHISRGYGSNSKALTCNGAKHKINISVVVSNDWPLKAGKALSRAVLDTSSETDEATAATERTITIS